METEEKRPCPVLPVDNIKVNTLILGIKYAQMVIIPSINCPAHPTEGIIYPAPVSGDMIVMMGTMCMFILILQMVKCPLNIVKICPDMTATCAAMGYIM